MTAPFRTAERNDRSPAMVTPPAPSAIRLSMNSHSVSGGSGQLHRHRATHQLRWQEPCAASLPPFAVLVDQIPSVALAAPDWCAAADLMVRSWPRSRGPPPGQGLRGGRSRGTPRLLDLNAPIRRMWELWKCWALYCAPCLRHLMPERYPFTPFVKHLVCTFTEGECFASLQRISNQINCLANGACPSRR